MQEVQRQRRTQRRYFSGIRCAVYFRTFQARTVDGREVGNLPICYTWRRHNAIVTLWPPKYGQPHWRIKCSLGLRGYGSSVEQEAPEGSDLLEVMQKACSIIDDLMAHERLQYSDPNRAWRISSFLEEIIRQCQPADQLVTAG